MTVPAAIGVDLLLDVWKQVGSVLHLIEDHRRAVHFQEAARILQGTRTNVRWFQRNIPAMPTEEALEEGCLAGLPRSGHDYGWKLGGGLLEDRLQRTFNVMSHPVHRLVEA